GAMEDRFLQGPGRAHAHILGRECRLGLGDFFDCLIEVAPVGGAAVENAGLVEVDVRFDKASRNEPAGEIDYFGLNPKMRLDRDDFSILDSNIGAAAILAGKPCVPQNEVHVSSLSQSLVLTEIGA